MTSPHATHGTTASSDPVVSLRTILETIIRVRAGLVGEFQPGLPLSIWGKADEMARLAAEALLIIGDAETPRSETAPLVAGDLKTQREIHDSYAPSAIGAIAEIAAERQRQKDREGWSEEHDDGHTPGSLAVAGACYALQAAARSTACLDSWRHDYDAQARNLWPWDEESWKPKDARRSLVRSAALIVAEIERMDREAK